MRCRLLVLALCLTGTPATASDPSLLASLIDQQLATHHTADGIVPAPAADDSEFLRRASLDLLGHIPAADDVVTFHNDRHPKKRGALVDRLLANPEHADHFARVWRGLLLPEADTDRNVQYLVPGFEAWLRDKRRSDAGFDVLVRELVACSITGTAERPQLVVTDLSAANPLAFIAAKEADPARLAAATTRLFLGVRLECAQCHDHPFAEWTQQQFWHQAAFFGGLERRGRGTFAPILEVPQRRTIHIMDKDVTVEAKYLNQESPAGSENESLRRSLADWMTSPDNPYFSRAIVNRVWGQLMGTGLVDPVDDMHDGSSILFPEVLDRLAKKFADSGFDLTFLYATICRTQAYQRTSRQTDPSQHEPATFARMAIKPLSGEQFCDSLSLAMGINLDERDPRRRKMIELFASQGLTRDPETSVLQNLTMMNGRLVTEAVDPQRGGILTSLLTDASLTDTERVERLYLSTLGRWPTPSERQLLEKSFEYDPGGDHAEALADVLWSLVNSAEFRWNH